MVIKDDRIFSNEEIDLLQEIMNIGFGQAAADLAEVVDIFININTPNLNVLKALGIGEYMEEEIRDFDKCSIVSQNYLGDTRGIALLVFSENAEKELLNLLPGATVHGMETDAVGELEKEVLLEIGNILIGACVGKMIELLKSSLTYMPPRSIVGEDFQSLQETFEPGSYALLLKTDFGFEDRNVSGYLFLVFSQESIDPLKNAMKNFMSQYE